MTETQATTYSLIFRFERGGKMIDEVRVEAERTTGYKCLDCEAIRDEANEVKLYECSGCGNVFNAEEGEGRGNQCPECHKFGSKKADRCCIECGEGEVDEVELIPCPECGDFFEEEDWAKHILEDHPAALALG